VNLNLFGAPLAPLQPESRTERQAVLDALPQAPPQLHDFAPQVRSRNEKRPVVARALVDPVGHLHTCLDPGCGDCAALIEQGFQQCGIPGCARWSHRSCQYPDFDDPDLSICTTCMITAGRPLDGRENRYEWTPPAALLSGGLLG
jgi:hypothetical protein